AAIVKSPSFSRSWSSTTMTIRPARTASTAFSMDANGDAVRRAPLAISMRRFMFGCRPFQSCQFGGSSDVFSHQIAFQVHQGERLNPAQICMLHRKRDHLYIKAVRNERCNRQANAVNRDRSLDDEEGRQIGGKTGPKAVAVTFRPEQLE